MRSVSPKGTFVALSGWRLKGPNKGPLKQPSWLRRPGGLAFSRPPSPTPTIRRRPFLSLGTLPRSKPGGRPDVPLALFYCIFIATAAAVQQTRHITPATTNGVISKCIAKQADGRLIRKQVLQRIAGQPAKSLPRISIGPPPHHASWAPASKKLRPSQPMEARKESPE